MITGMERLQPDRCRSARSFPKLHARYCQTDESRPADVSPEKASGEGEKQPMTEQNDCVLIVDDDWMIADLWSMVLDDMGMRVCGPAATAEAAIKLAQAHRPSVVLMDVRLRSKVDGVDAAIAIRSLVGSRIIFVTGSREPETVARMQTGQPAAILSKPVSDQRLQAAIRAAMRN
jgi:CheY-like chemotaxis protein